MTDILMNQDFLNSIIDVISYQNKLLIKQISQDKGWDLKKLKKYIKDPLIQTPIDNESVKPKKKRGRKPKKKVIEEETLEVEEEPVKVVIKPIEVVEEPIKVVEEPVKVVIEPVKVESDDEKIKIISKRKIVRRKKISKDNSKKDFRCLKIKFLNEMYYLEEDTNNVYSFEMVEYVGKLEGEKINFDVEECE
jgi:hypothetical protein